MTELLQRSQTEPSVPFRSSSFKCLIAIRFTLARGGIAGFQSAASSFQSAARELSDCVRWLGRCLLGGERTRPGRHGTYRAIRMRALATELPPVSAKQGSQIRGARFRKHTGGGTDVNDVTAVCLSQTLGSHRRETNPIRLHSYRQKARRAEGKRIASSSIPSQKRPKGNESLFAVRVGFSRNATSGDPDVLISRREQEPARLRSAHLPFSCRAECGRAERGGL
ncbi:hypothetical protein AAFF_G00214220 [Aldrovandia affinis]|uniref:Uncharacterized protein n=1 Tax=Aldrovandia affinis TaxID=143900 RepID=A0AAD7RGW8_9TELE|nr:hypothetical protein AAFF_G00214220 [Aldrovandia affinis]